MSSQEANKKCDNDNTEKAISWHSRFCHDVLSHFADVPSIFFSLNLCETVEREGANKNSML